MLGEFNHIAVANVAFIGAGVNGDALGAKSFTIQSHLKYVGVVTTASISDGGDFVDVDREFGLGYFHHSDTKIRGWKGFSVVFFTMISVRSAMWVCLWWECLRVVWDRKLMAVPLPDRT